MIHSASELETIIEARVFNNIQAAEAICAEKSVMELTRLIRQGINGECLRHLSRVIPRSILADALGADRSNFSKLYHRRLSGLETDQINDLSMLWLEVREFVENDEKTLKAWLSSSIADLNDETPQVLMSTIIGREILRSYLLAIRHNDFT